MWQQRCQSFWCLLMGTQMLCYGAQALYHVKTWRNCAEVAITAWAHRGYEHRLGVQYAGLVHLLPQRDSVGMLLCRWHEEAAKAQKQPRGSLSAELLRAVSAVSDALRGACGSSGGGGTAVAAQQEAEAAANAVAAALVQVCKRACCPDNQTGVRNAPLGDLPHLSVMYDITLDTLKPN
jgi:hypothetical protein